MRVVAETRARWGTASPLGAARQCPSPPVAVIDQPWRAPWLPAQPSASRTGSLWILSARADVARLTSWAAYAARLAMPARSSWVLSSVADRTRQSPWAAYAARLAMPARSSWVVSLFADQSRLGPWGLYHPAGAGWQSVMAHAWPRGRVRWLPWSRYSRLLSPGWGVVVEPGGPPVDDQGTVIVPVLGAYIVLNDVTLIRVADNLQLDCLALTLTLDAESWVCGFDATVPGAALDDVVGSAGSPVELEAAVNGILFRLLAEWVGRDRAFGKSRIKISGRGRAAVLDDPYAPLMSYASAPAITAQQAAEAAITAAGLPVGWTLDWQLTDWLLPAGLWSHRGSPISAVNRIAQAAGGYVQADAVNQVLHILPRYPVAPWGWSGATPDIELPVAVAITEGIAWDDKPAYNAVYVSGASGGVLGHVKRAGTAGDLVAEMVTDDLITHVDAARQRGTAILADTGRQARISLSLPVLDETGIILPGQLVRYVDGATTRLGLARSVSINASLPKVRQTVGIETHG